MAVKLDSFRLWQGQETRVQSQGNVRVDAVYGEDSKDTLLTGLEAQDEVTYSGRVTGIRLSQQSGYSNDPATALAEWVAEFETFVNGTQGTGYTLTDDDRNDTKNVLLKMVGWQRSQGEKYEVTWDLEGVWAQGMMVDENTSAASVSPSTSWTLGGYDLHGFESIRQQKIQEIKTYPLAYANRGENEATAGSGAYKRIIITGDVTETGASSTVRNDFDDNMQSLIGQDQIVTFSEAFPGRDLDVMVKNYESTREAGMTRYGKYSLELIEGYAY